MSRSTPEEVFRTAQAAMTSGDLAGFFRCVDTADLRTIVENAVKVGMAKHSGEDGEFRAICERHGFPLRDLRAKWDARQWKEFQQLLKQGLKGIAGLPEFVAAIEQRNHAIKAGASISQSIFVGEELQELEVQDKRATAVRLIDGRTRLPVKFNKKRDGWVVKLIVRG